MDIESVQVLERVELITGRLVTAMHFEVFGCLPYFFTKSILHARVKGECPERPAHGGRGRFIARNEKCVTVTCPRSSASDNCIAPPTVAEAMSRLRGSFVSPSAVSPFCISSRLCATILSDSTWMLWNPGRKVLRARTGIYLREGQLESRFPRLCPTTCKRIGGRRGPCCVVN